MGAALRGLAARHGGAVEGRSAATRVRPRGEWPGLQRSPLSPPFLCPSAPPSQELAHYALATTDLEFAFPFGWDELWGIANRGDFDLRAHSRASGLELVYREPGTAKVRQRRGQNSETAKAPARSLLRGPGHQNSC